MNPPWTGPEDRLDAADVAALRDAGIRSAVARAAATSPFYRDLFARHALDPASFQGAGDLARLPFTTKTDVSAGGEAFRAVPMERVVDVATTSGTTGLPTLYPLTEGDLDRLGHNERLSMGLTGLTSADTVLLAVTLDRCFMAGLAYFEGLRKLGCAVVRTGSASPAMLLDLMARVRATAIVSVPTFLLKVAQYAADEGIPLDRGAVRRLVCIGEPIRNEDLTLNPLGSRLERLWGARVHSTYGITELAGSCCECEAGRGGHVHPSLLHLEVVDDTGAPCPDGVPGEVVATPLGVEAMPLLRYRTGDVAALFHGPCACGRATPRLGPILGRRNQAMKIKGTTVYPAAVQRVLDAFEEIVAYVLILRSADALSDDLEVVIQLRPGEGEAALLERAGERLRGALKVRPRLRSAGADEMERLQGSLRKKRIFLDERR